jgi:hypothetical protein
MICTYVEEQAESLLNKWHGRVEPASDQTITGYASAAMAWLCVILWLDALAHPLDSAQHSSSLLPFVQEIISQHQNW